MARYIRDFQVNADPQTLYNMLGQYLQSEGYEYVQYEGENVFKKGLGLMSGPTFFKFSYSANTVRMETWMKYALLPGVFVGEIGTTGFVGFVAKGPWKGRIQRIESIIAGFANPYAANQQPQYVNSSGNFYSGGNGSGTLQSSESVLSGNTQTGSADSADRIATVRCGNCGKELPSSARFCSVCGQTVESSYVNTNSAQPMQPFGQANPGDPQFSSQLPPPGQPVSRKEYIEKYAPASIKKEIMIIAIVCYICAGVTFILACILNPLGIIEAALLLGLALGMHLAKSKVCAILILIFSIIECIMGLIMSGTFPLWWILAGIAAVVVFSKIDKQYKQFINSN